MKEWMVFVLLGVLVLLALVPLRGLVRGPVQPPEKLEFVLATNKTTFLVGEPVKVNFKLTNKSDQILTADFHL